MWREPAEADSYRTATEKDRSATGRSSIRRQATIRRPSRYTGSSSHARGAGVLSSLPSQILDEIHRGMIESPSDVRSPVLNLGVSEDGMDLDTSRRDALRNDRAARRLDAMGAPTRHPRSRHRQSNTRWRWDWSTRDQSLDRLLPSSRIRWAAHDQSSGPLVVRSDPRPAQPSSQDAPLTPHFAPALSYYTTVSSHSPSESVRLPPLRRAESRSDDRANYNAARVQEFEEFQEGYRAGLESAGVDPDTWNGEPLVVGLGDRERSMSPAGERGTDAWETLLSTITPDATLPSNSSSFGSNPTSTTDASRNGTSRTSANSSSQTLPTSLGSSRTAPTGLDPYPDHLHPCDFSSSDEEDTLINYRRVPGPSGRSVSLRRRSPGLPSTMSSGPPIPTFSFSFSDSSSDPDLHPDLHQMQAILDRLARREDIPDDWWAAAGLSRIIGRGLRASANMTENGTESAPRHAR